jgi:alkylated DNA nucleotide flippase Atl1
MPTGTWTTYGDVAELVGSHPVPVGAFLATKSGVHGAYRVLTSDGKVSGNFRWPGGEHGGDPRELLKAEGVPFDEWGRARRSHRLSAADLATLLGKDVPESGEARPLPTSETAERAVRFEALLREDQPDTAEGVLRVLRRWQQLDPSCRLEYGAGSETSCFPIMDRGAADKPPTIWPLALYPTAGTAEVVFQHLCNRAPFDDASLRRELMERFNAIDGVELAEAKLELRPSFPLEVLATHPDEVMAVLEWFAHTVALHLAQDGT